MKSLQSRLRSRSRGWFGRTLKWSGLALGVGGLGAIGVMAWRRAARRAAAEPVLFAVTIARPPREVYDYYRDFMRLPQFMTYLDRVELLDGARSRWTAKLPTGGTLTWEAEVVEDHPGELIAWQTIAGAPVALAGRVTFTPAPGGSGTATEVRVAMKLGIAGQKPSALAAKIFAKPQVKGDLRRLKQVLEAGEVLYSDASQHIKPHPARPAAADEQVHRPTVVFIPTPPRAEKGAE